VWLKVMYRLPEALRAPPGLLHKVPGAALRVTGQKAILMVQAIALFVTMIKSLLHRLPSTEVAGRP